MTSTSSLLLRLATIGLVGLGAASLSACGRNGDPELPTVGKPQGDRPVGIPIGPSAPAPKLEPAQKKPFLLDPLL